MTPLLKLAFWSLFATIALVSAILWEIGIGREVPGVLMNEFSEFVVKDAKAAKTEVVVDASSTTEAKVVPAIPEPETHIVRKGEWLSKIAAVHGVTVAALVKTNRELYPSLAKDPSLIHPGWKLFIPITITTAHAVIHSSPEKSVTKQSVHPETIAKAVPRDKRTALSKEDARKRITKKEPRGTRHPETALRLKLSRELPRVDTIVKAYSPIVEEAARKYRVPKYFIYGLIYHESGGDTHAIGDGGKSRGLMQLHDPTRIRLGLSKKEAHDPEKAIPAGTRYLREQYDAFGKDPIAAISAYNAPYLTQKMIARGGNPSDRTYVRSVGAAAKLFKEYEKLTAM
ncbi:MAG: LysM peptidoglycan-binding domain-containing protein [Candidatus Moranbacteria bacterium]|nr:LysM peptidoglycan-binding domain-containing protein [Candidatus Moranbacteria bacterium]